MAKPKSIMKQLFLITTLLSMLAGCNKNESKEARIRKLEAEVQQATSELRDLEGRVQAIESPIEANEQ